MTIRAAVWRRWVGIGAFLFAGCSSDDGSTSAAGKYERACFVSGSADDRTCACQPVTEGTEGAVASCPTLDCCVRTVDVDGYTGCACRTLAAGSSCQVGTAFVDDLARAVSNADSTRTIVASCASNDVKSYDD